jgi:hypothetical protein
MDRLEAALKDDKLHSSWITARQDLRDAAEAVLAEQVRADDPDVKWLREWTTHWYDKDDAARMNALLDRLVGPAPKPHRRCVCGSEVSASWRDTARNKYHAQCQCGRAGPYADTIAGAWAAWDAEP